MDLATPFSYRCGCCGRCCRDKVITLAPYDVMRMAQAAGIGTAQTIARFTLRRGSLLRFDTDGCLALSRGLCTIHSGRPLPCRLYPLGLEWIAQESSGAAPSFVKLEPAAGSSGIYGADGSVAQFLDRQGVEPYLRALPLYSTLLPSMRSRIRALVDFEKTDPAEFRRVAVREALAESDYDYNPLIEMLFDSDPWSGFAAAKVRSPARHVSQIEEALHAGHNAAQIAAAAVLLAVSLGYTPAAVFAD